MDKTRLLLKHRLGLTMPDTREPGFSSTIWTNNDTFIRWTGNVKVTCRDLESEQEVPIG